MKRIYLSDLHIDPQSDGTSTENLKEGLINYINDHHITADDLFVTGDYHNACMSGTAHYHEITHECPSC